MTTPRFPLPIRSVFIRHGKRGWSLRLAVVALLIAVAAAIAADAPPTLPKILFILADDLGPGDLGCCGGTVVPTPNLDRLAREGTRFTQYYAAAPICSPSRAGLLTGQFPGRWRITSFLQTRAGNRACGQADFLDPAAPSLPRILKGAGYATAHFGKWHLGGGRDVTNAPPFAQYEGGMRLPFIARWPGRVPAGRVDDQTVLGAVDLLPTLAALTRAPSPGDVALDGENMTAALEGKPAPRARPLFWEYGRNEKSFSYPPLPRDRSPNLAVRDGSWKLLVNADGSGAQLFDVVTDRSETNDLAAKQPGHVQRLTKLVLDWRKALP